MILLIDDANFFIPVAMSCIFMGVSKWICAKYDCKNREI